MLDVPSREFTPSWSRYLQRIARARNAQRAAKHRFACANLRLVVSIARRYSYGRIPLIDLIQEGNTGLMTAVERFDHRRGYRFSTYASWWIRHAVSRARADKERTVRLPVHIQEACIQVRRASERYARRTGRAPSVAELAEETQLAEAKVRKAQAQFTGSALSLDRPVSDDDGRCFVDFLGDEDAQSPQQEVAERAWHARVPRLLSTLTPIEARVLRCRFGLDGQPEHTLKAIGDHYNLSRERIRQIQQEALAKLRRQLPESPLLAS